jgi:hypothetical protein
MSILDQIVAGTAPSIVPLSVDQYHQMIAGGILREGDSIELIDGILIRKDRADKGGDPMSHGPRHAAGVCQIQEPFLPLRQQSYFCRVQLPVTLGGVQEPEPDVALVRGKPLDYVQRHPAPADIVSIMEVSDSSLTFDRTTKQRVYAMAVLPVYLILNLVENQLEVYQNPQPAEGKYAERAVYRLGQSVMVTLGPGLQVQVVVAEVMPV